MWRPQWRIVTVSGLLLFALAALYLIYQVWQAVGYLRAADDPRNQAFWQWAMGSESEREALVTAQRAACPGAPFILPSDGFVGLLYADPRGPYSASRPHQGIDIFSNAQPGVTPVYAAYDGYVSREAGWKSTLIQRVPQDPLDPTRQIWLYYTHMADRTGNDFIEEAFPPGTQEVFVPQGTLLGYTGDYNGASARTVWTHLHFSIVRDDGNGRYVNELEFNNTLDPSPYLGMALHYDCADGVVSCVASPECVP
ncbi:MAG: M23 family metallopeptidase [Anaerolinea sp.]|nr:M23 family metallopeptidase [Anaerolinea sp.]